MSGRIPDKSYDLSTIHIVKDLFIFSILKMILTAVIIVAVFIFPPEYGPTRLENFVLLFLALVLVIDNIKFDRNLVWIIGLNFLIGLIAVLLNLNEAHGIMELFRWVKYVLILIFFSNLNKRELTVFSLWMKTAFLLMVIINLIQIVNPLDYGEKLSALYSDRDLGAEGWKSIGKSFRLLGTAINPNNNAILFLLMSIYFLVEYFTEKKVISVICAFIGFILIVFTQSRTAFVVIAVIGILNLFLYKINITKIGYIILALSSAAFVAIWFRFTYLWHLFLYNPMEIHSLKLRFRVWDEMMPLYVEKPIFGWGNQKNYQFLFEKSADNELLYILINQGGFGVLGVTILYIYTLFYFWKHRVYNKYCYLPIFTLIAGIPIAMTNLFISNVRIGLYLFMVIGIAYAFLDKKNLKTNIS